MAPQRKTANPDDARTESTTTKDKTLSSTANSNPLKAKKVAGSSLKDVTNASAGNANDAAGAANGQSVEPGEAIKFADLPRPVLHAYRSAHHLNIPTSFASFHNQLVLSNPHSIGKFSPTMNRAKGKRRVSKEAIARAVRRDFMDQSVNELDVEASSCYIVRNGDKAFRMRFSPQSKKP